MKRRDFLKTLGMLPGVSFLGLDAIKKTPQKEPEPVKEDAPSGSAFAVKWPLTTGESASMTWSAPFGIEAVQPVYEVVLIGAGESRVKAMKAIREVLPSVFPQNAKYMVDNVPSRVLSYTTRERADEVAEKLRAAGAVMEVRMAQ